VSLRLPFQQQVSELARAREIVDIVMRHGLGALAQQWELTRFLPRRRRLTTGLSDGGVEDQLSIPQRARLAIEELGPTFIKLGQLGATRPDIFPAAYIVEFEKLLDAAPPVPIEQVRAVIQAELGASVESLFADFEPAPLASASIGQAHRATLLAVEAAYLPTMYKDAGEPWRVEKLYYTAFPRSEFRRIAEMAKQAGMDPPFGEENPDNMLFLTPDEWVTSTVDCRSVVGRKREALRAHRSQISADWPQLTISDDVAEQFATEYYQLIISRTPAVLPETDLFAGISPS